MAHNDQIQQVFPNGTEAVIIGDASESALFLRSIGAANATKGALLYIGYINDKSQKAFTFDTNEMLQENRKLFQKGLSEDNLLLKNNIITDKHLETIKLLTRLVTKKPVVIERMNLTGVKIKYKQDANFKANLALFIRFILKKHANNNREHFFQNLLVIKQLDTQAISLDYPNELCELLSLYINLAADRNPVTEVTHEETQQCLTELHREYSQSQTACLYPEMSAEQLFEYLKRNNQLGLIDLIIREPHKKPHIIGLTQFRNPGDFCSLYEVVNHHFDNAIFFNKLVQYKDQGLSIQSPNDQEDNELLSEIVDDEVLSEQNLGAIKTVLAKQIHGVRWNLCPLFFRSFDEKRTVLLQLQTKLEAAIDQGQHKKVKELIWEWKTQDVALILKSHRNCFFPKFRPNIKTDTEELIEKIEQEYQDFYVV